MTSSPLVDIVVITYNHEKFIARTIESVLAQQTTFAYRLLIGDDCSTDSTQQIVAAYAAEHPGRIEALLDTEHRGLADRDRVGLRVMKLCTAKYVAWLDGDDYWLSPHKLQRQVDYLESHPECVMCFHDVEVVYEDGTQEGKRFCRPGQKEISTLEDLLGGNFIPTSSLVFRGGLVEELPEWYYESKMGDWPMHVFNAQHGNIRYFNEVMAAYRVHRGAGWSLLSSASRITQSIEVIDHLNAHLGFKYERRVKRTKAAWYGELAGIYFQQGDLGRSREFAARSFALNPFNLRNLRALFMSQTPWLYNRAKMLKSFIRSAVSG